MLDPDMDDKKIQQPRALTILCSLSPSLIKYLLHRFRRTQFPGNVHGHCGIEKVL